VQVSQFHVTVVPAATVRLAGAKELFCTVTVLGAAGVLGVAGVEGVDGVDGAVGLVGVPEPPPPPPPPQASGPQIMRATNPMKGPVRMTPTPM
jgi:hypothetical protein